MSRPFRSTTRLVVPAHPDFFQALRHSLSFHLRLFGIPRPAAAFANDAFEQILTRARRRRARGIAKVHLILKASPHALHILVQLPGAPASPRKRVRLPVPPAGIAIREGKRAVDALTLIAAIPGRD